MFETLLRTDAARRRHREAPFAAERERYLQRCADLGAARSSLLTKSRELLWIARFLDPDASQGVGMEQLQRIVRQRTSVHLGATTAQRVIAIARPWLRFLGWWRTPKVILPFQDQLDFYVAWMRNERGFSVSTVMRWQDHVKTFLQWCATTDLRLGDLQPSDIDQYFVSEGAQRWCRVTVSGITSALRVFLRYAATQGLCDPHLADTIRGPRVYQQESLPFAPAWSDVRRILTDTATDSPRDVRNRAILMLLSIYGMRRGEVASLRLDQVDWHNRRLQLFRLKRRQPQVYPLVLSVAEALACYIDTVRPPTSYSQIFIGLQSPRRPLTPSAIYSIVRQRFDALGIQVAHRGPHALRHACATRLIAEGITLKEIGDHLGHRSTSATRIYTKIDLAALREVGDFDLGDLP
ncbi:MAG: tyrosine-type recombinase/integrase [Hyphomicrobium sp.]